MASGPTRQEQKDLWQLRYEIYEDLRRIRGVHCSLTEASERLQKIPAWAQAVAALETLEQDLVRLLRF
jgi:hypothetical protein